MSTESKALDIINRTRTELGEELFTDFFDSITEQAGMTPEQSAALAAYVDPKSDAPQILVKRDDFASFIHRWEAEAEYIRSQEVLLAERRHNIEKFLSGLKGGLQIQLENFGVRKVAGRLHSFFIKRNPRRVEIMNEDLLPTEFIEYKATPKKAAIKDALEAGRDVPGACWANGTSHLEIK